MDCIVQDVAAAPTIHVSGPTLDELARLLAQQDATEGLTDEDAVPELQETPVSTLGDCWRLGAHRLAVGDATEVVTVERLMGADSADLVFTDPPYNVDYEGYTEEKLTIKGDKMESLKKWGLTTETRRNYGLKSGDLPKVSSCENGTIRFNTVDACKVRKIWSVRTFLARENVPDNDG